MRPIDNLVQYINNNPNWIKEIGSDPYYIKVKEWKPGFFMLSYDMIRTKWGDEDSLTRACRGIVIRYLPNNSIGEKVVVICYALNKFFNAGEPTADKIDFQKDNITISQKVDGNLVKLCYVNGEPVWFTNNGFTSNYVEKGILWSSENDNPTWQDLIDKCLRGREKMLYSKSDIIGNYTLWFELFSPETSVVIHHHEYDLVFLGARNMTTFEEIDFDRFNRIFPGVMYKFKTPKIYTLARNKFNVEGFREFANTIPNNEGFVIYNQDFKRLKVKSDWYLAAHRCLDSNGNITPSVVYESIRKGIIDDIIGTFPEYTDYCQQMIREVQLFDNSVCMVISNCKVQWSGIQETDQKLKKKIYAEWVMRDHPYLSTLCFNIPKQPDWDIQEQLDWFLTNHCSRYSEYENLRKFR